MSDEQNPTGSNPVVQSMTSVEYSDPGRIDPVTLRYDPGTESIWATQAQIAQLFETDRTSVTKHLGNIFSAGELTEESNVQKVHFAHSSKPVQVYSLDAVISVGYRVNSRAATRFRQWATGVLKTYIEQGYVLNEKALRESPDALNRLAEDIRSLRAEEKTVYEKVRECFKISASDYNPSSSEVRSFYSLMQDKFHYAVTGQTGAKLVQDRADHEDENMGVQTFKGRRPTLAEAKIGKNYLEKEEIYLLHILCEQFLLYAESTALRGKSMTMRSLHGQLDRVLVLNEYELFEGYTDFLRDEAERHARIEYTRYVDRLKVEDAGYVYDKEGLLSGEYDHIIRPDLH